MPNPQTRRYGRRLVECGYPDLLLPPMESRLGVGVVLGREPANGYSRGVGLEFGNVVAQLHQHPLYAEALRAAKGRSVVSERRLMNLFMIIAYFFDELEHRNIVEFGAYRGGSSLFMAHLLRRLYPEASLLAFDTFAGMPSVDSSADLHRVGDFSEADLPGLMRAREEGGLDSLTIVQGLVQETFPASLPAGMRIGLAHFDMDILEPTIYAQTKALPFMTRGGYYIYDDATVSSCIGATQAVEDLVLKHGLRAEQIFPHFVFRVGL